MKGKKILFPLMAASFAVSAAVLTAVLIIHGFFPETGWIADALTVGLTMCVTAFLSFIFAYLINKSNKHTRARFPRPFCAFSLVLSALLFLLGSAGQIAYAIDTKTYDVQTGEREERETVNLSENADIVMLLDDSGSMYEYKINEVIRDACKQVVSGVSESCRMGCGVFTDIIDDRNFLDLHLMDADGKKAINDLLTDAKGQRGFGNDFKSALERAYTMLTTQSSEDRHRIIVMFTDGIESGMDKFDAAQNKKIADAGIEVYAVRPNVYSSMCSETFLDLVTSGGKTPERDNLIDINGTELDLSSVVNALNSVTNKQEEKVTIVPVFESRTDVVFNKGLILYDGANSPALVKNLIRAGFFVLWSILIQLLFFRKIRPAGLAFNIAASLASFGLVLLGSWLKIPVIASPALAAGMFTLFAAVQSQSTADPQTYDRSSFL